MPYGGIDLGQHCSSNGLLPDGTKPLPEPVLINHQWGHSPKGNFMGNAQDIYPWTSLKIINFKVTIVSPKLIWGSWCTCDFVHVWHMPLSLPGDGGAYAQWFHPEWMCMTYASFSARWCRCLCPMTPPWVNVYDICLFLCQVMEVPMPNDSTLSECVWHMPLSLPGDGGAYAQWLHPEWMCMTYASFSARWWRCLCPMTPPWVNVYDICLFLCQVM